MPFTFSHAAVVLPFVKNKKLSASALIVGTLSPDLWYFFTMSLEGGLSHTFLGVLIVDLPLGLLALFLFHLVIKKTLLPNLPIFFKVRTQELLNFDWVNYFKENYLVVFLSIIFGAFSHLALDSLTHCDGYFVMNFQAYNTTFLGIPVFVYMHRLTSIIGLVWITTYFYDLPVSKKAYSKIKKTYWFLNIIIAAIVFYNKFSCVIPRDDKELQTLLVIMFSSGIIALICTGLIFDRKKTAVE
jgi:hypothetical protein